MDVRGVDDVAVDGTQGGHAGQLVAGENQRVPDGEVQWLNDARQRVRRRSSATAPARMIFTRISCATYSVLHGFREPRHGRAARRSRGRAPCRAGR